MNRLALWYTLVLSKCYNWNRQRNCQIVEKEDVKKRVYVVVTTFSCLKMKYIIEPFGIIVVERRSVFSLTPIYIGVYLFWGKTRHELHPEDTELGVIPMLREVVVVAAALYRSPVLDEWYRITLYSLPILFRSRLSLLNKRSNYRGPLCLHYFELSSCPPLPPLAGLLHDKAGLTPKRIHRHQRATIFSRSRLQRPCHH